MTPPLTRPIVSELPAPDSPEALRHTARQRATESECDAAQRLLQCLELTDGALHRATTTAIALVTGARSRGGERSVLDEFLQEFGLSNQEGIALMCIAEALLRIPDDDTADRLIAEQLKTGQWAAHAGRSESLFVNASTWGLMLTGRILELDPAIRSEPQGWLRTLIHRVGERVIRVAVRRAIGLMGGEFVVGRSIEAAKARAAREPEIALCSFDMLGEGARTAKDAIAYFAAYEHAIEVIGKDVAHRAPHEVSGISIKLSALEPRYTQLQHARVRARLLPQVQYLAQKAAAAGIQLTIDAEEADRLDLSLSIIDALANDRATQDWPGLGLAVQAYNKSVLDVIEWVAATARATGRRMTLRLVKGAYWDSEIKRAQERGLDTYPVYTRKVTTDVSYLACVEHMFREVDVLYPQFATHNAHSIASIVELAPPRANYEFQRLHGMGRHLYAEAARQIPNFPKVRVYAPVGAHKDLLAYLVRRLLENGANTSFVNRFMDKDVPVADLVRDPVGELVSLSAIAHPRIPLPSQLFADRRNSAGVDLGSPEVLESIRLELMRLRSAQAISGPIINCKLCAGTAHPGAVHAITNPADRRDVVGSSRHATPDEIVSALDLSVHAQPAWNARGVISRADCLIQAGALLEQRRLDFYNLLIREAGKTLPDAIAEVREAVDFCRYYALRATEQFSPARLEGPTGEVNELSLQGRGVFACISPWNFPLAIFAGQVTAALVAGNAVIAKPAEPTPLIAAAFVRLLHESGIPGEVLHLIPAPGALFGKVAFAHPGLAGVAMTGSNVTALTINRSLAARDGAILPLIAETGGLNAMIVDSTALPEQVVDDVIQSAFMSAGQRCSALRLLFLQDDIADNVIDMIVGAMDELVIGDPANFATDVGPVITATAAKELDTHLRQLQAEAKFITGRRLDDTHVHGSFFPPQLIELHRPEQLTQEAFGPILHIVRYKARDIGKVLQSIRASGYGLTLGVQTRLESSWRNVWRSTPAGNIYVNRNMIGAVVGVQPFGGTGLSGTGPKAGGPHYLARFATERTLTVNTTATGGNTDLLNLAANS